MVGVDTAGRGDNSRHRWASACAELTCALAVDKKPFVSLLTTPNSKELRELAAVPHWARIAVLRPKFKCECDFSNYDCQRTENNRRCSRCCAVQLQWLMQIAHAEELEYCQLHRSHGSKKRNYLTNDDLTLASGDVLSAAQHGQLTTMFKRLRNEIAHCANMEHTLADVTLPTGPVTYVDLHQFWTEVGAPEHIIDIMENALLKPSTRQLQLSKGKQRQLGALVVALATESGFSSCLKRQMNSCRV